MGLRHRSLCRQTRAWLSLQLRQFATDDCSVVYNSLPFSLMMMVMMMMIMMMIMLLLMIMIMMTTTIMTDLSQDPEKCEEVGRCRRLKV